MKRYALAMILALSGCGSETTVVEDDCHHCSCHGCLCKPDGTCECDKCGCKHGQEGNGPKEKNEGGDRGGCGGGGCER